MRILKFICEAQGVVASVQKQRLFPDIVREILDVSASLKP
jgi:hypothetical protein